jgi:hypothetical protein
MVTFKSEDWQLVQSEAEQMLKNQRDILENPNKTYKEKLIANGQVLALKRILNLPQNPLPHKD